MVCPLLDPSREHNYDQRDLRVGLARALPRAHALERALAAAPFRRRASTRRYGLALRGMVTCPDSPRRAAVGFAPCAASALAPSPSTRAASVPSLAAAAPSSACACQPLELPPLELPPPEPPPPSLAPSASPWLAAGCTSHGGTRQSECSLSRRRKCALRPRGRVRSPRPRDGLACAR